MSGMDAVAELARWKKWHDESAEKWRIALLEAGRRAERAEAERDALRALLAEARRKPVVGLYVVATAKGRPISLKRLGDVWRVVRGAAGVSGAQFRDIRAKAATDAEAAGMDYQAMLGHATKAMSDRYVKAMRTIKAQPLRAIK